MQIKGAWPSSWATAADVLLLVDGLELAELLQQHVCVVNLWETLS
jgi:hypothetical protein